MFGEAGDTEVTITIDKVKDELNQKLTFAGNSNKNIDKNEGNILNINSREWKKLYTQKKPATDTRPTKDTAIFTVSRTLSHEDIDKDADIDTTTFNNKAEVVEIHVTGHTTEAKLVENVNTHKTDKYDNYFKYEFSNVTWDNPSATNSLIITPPTGADKMTIIIYIVIAAVSGIIITIGIIVIKKKVLNK